MYTTSVLLITSFNSGFAMYLLSILDVPSLLFSSSALVVGGISGGKNIQKGIAIARDIAIPIGIIGTLIGFVNMLSSLDDPSALGPAIGVSFLTTLYGLILFVLCNIAVSQFPDENIEKQGPIILQNGIAAGVFMMVLVAAMNTGGAALHFIDLTSIIIVFLFAVLPTLLVNSKPQVKRSYFLNLSRDLCTYSLVTLFAGMLYSGIMMLLYSHDPSAIGPAMAVGLLTPFYCCLLIVTGIVANITLKNEQKRDIRTSITIASICIGTSIFIACCVGILFSLI